MEFIANKKKLVFGILLCAGLLRIGFILGTQAYLNPVTVEGGIIAHGIIQGYGFSAAAPGTSIYYPSALQPPVFPYLLAGIYYFIGENIPGYLFLFILQTCLSVGISWMIYQMGKLLLNETTGIIGMLLSAIFPMFIIYSGRALNTMVSIFTVTLFTYLFFKATHPSFVFKLTANKIKICILLGISGGISILSEPIMLIIIPMIGIIAILSIYRSQTLGKTERIKQIRFILLAGILIGFVIFPWTWRNYMVFHRFIPVRSMAGLNIWLGNNPQATGTDRLPTGKTMFDLLPSSYHDSTLPEPVRDDILFEIAKDFIRENPGTAIRLFLKKCYFFWWFPPKEIITPDAAKYAQFMSPFYLFLLATAILGSVLLLKKKNYYLLAVIGIYFLSYMGVYAISHFAHFRYRAPIEPFLFLLTGYFISLFTKPD